MKIIYIATSVIPSRKANALQVMKTCEALKKQGADIELIIPVRFGSTRIKEDPFKFYKIKDKFKITKVFSIDLIPFGKIIGSFGFWIQNFSFAVFTVIYLFFKKSEIYYSRNALSTFILSFFKKNIFYELHRLPRSLFSKSIFKYSLKRIQGLIVIAEELKRAVLEKSVFDSDKIAVVHDGVDLAQFDSKLSKKEARQKLNWPIDKKIICYTGSLQYVKGVDILIKAIDFLPEIYCYIIGPRASLLKGDKCSYKTENKRIIFLGQKPYNLVPIFLKAADVLVIPHRDLAFSFSPMKMFEYMASGRSIIASDLPSLREVLNKKNAILVEPDNPSALAKGINFILKNPNFSAEISKQAHKDVHKYTWNKRAKKILGFIA